MKKSIRQTIFKLCNGLRYKHGIIVLYSVRQCWSVQSGCTIKVRSLDLYFPPTRSKVNLYQGTKELQTLLKLVEFWNFVDKEGGDPDDFIQRESRRRKEEWKKRKAAAAAENGS